MASQGETRREALENLDEAVKLTLEARAEDARSGTGRPLVRRVTSPARDFSGEEIVAV